MTKKHVKLLIGFVVSAIFLYIAFKPVDWSQMWTAFKATNWFLGILMMAVTMASFFWRAIRWKIFLAPVKNVPATRLYPPLMIGFAFNNIFPLRVGEFARPLALTKSEGIPYGAALSSVVLERIIDSLTLLGFLIAVPMMIKLDPTITMAVPIKGLEHISVSVAWLQSRMPLISILAAVLMCGAISFLIPPIKNLYLKILDLLPLIPPGIKEKLAGFVNSVAEGFSSLKSPKAIVLTIVHSLVIWFSVAFSFQLMSWGFPGVSISFPQALAFLVVTCVVITIPSSPGYWGIYEFGGMVALIMMGVVPNTPEGQTRAVAFTMVVHFLQWLPMTVYGLWAASRLGLSAGDAQQMKETK